MTSDLYQQWLEIPPGSRPPTHYALLGVELFEAEEAKIRAAAAARIKQIRKYSLKFPHESTKLLNEVAAAEVCLTQPASKGEYDQQLRAKLEPQKPAVPIFSAAAIVASVVPEPAAKSYDLVPEPPAATPKPRTGRNGRPSVAPDKVPARPAAETSERSWVPVIVAGMVVSVAFLVGVGLLAWRLGNRGPMEITEATGEPRQVAVVPAASPPASGDPTPGDSEKQPGSSSSPPPKGESKLPTQTPAVKPAPPSVPLTALSLVQGYGEVSERLDATDPVDSHPTKGPSFRHKIYSVQLKEGHAYAIALRRLGNTWDPRLRVEDPSGKTVELNDDGGGNSDALIRFTPAKAGSHRIIASHQVAMQFGEFLLAVQESGPGSSPPRVLSLSNGYGEVRDRIDLTVPRDPSLNKFTRIYPLELKASHTYVMELRQDGASWDPLLRVENSPGKLMAFNDNAGGGRRDSKVTFTAFPFNQPGGRVIVTHAGDRPGPFTLTVTETAPAVAAAPKPATGAPPPGPFDPSKGPITHFATLTASDAPEPLSRKPAKEFSVNLRGAQNYLFEIRQEAPGLSPALRLFGPSGTVRATADNPGFAPSIQLRATPLVTGVHKLYALSASGQGPFVLTIQEELAVAKGNAPPMNPGPGSPPAMTKKKAKLPAPVANNPPLKNIRVQDLTLGRASRTGNLLPQRDADDYAFRLPAGFSYSVEVTSRVFEPAVDIVNADGDGVAAEDVGKDNPRLVFRVEQGGVHYISVTSLGARGPMPAAGLPPFIPFGPGGFGQPMNAGGAYSLQIARGAAFKQDGDLIGQNAKPPVAPIKGKVHDLTLVKNAAKIDETLGPADEEKVFSFPYKANQELTVEVTAKLFRPRVWLTRTDGQPVEGMFKERGDDGRLIYRGATASYLYLHVGSGNGAVGVFNLKLRME